MKSAEYSIKDLEVLSGVKMHTIRIWEKRYNVLNPTRTDTNIRLYDDSDLRRLLNISLLIKNGYKISKVASWSESDIKNVVVKVSETKNADPDYVDRFIFHMINFDNVEIEKLLSEVLADYEFEEAYFKVFFKLFERVGTYWQVGSVFPAQEHYISNLFRQKLISAIDNCPVKGDRSAMLFFLPENELHEISLLFYSYLARKQGFNVVYLGQSVPFDDLVKIQSRKEIQYVFTAFINSVTKTTLEEYLVRLKDVFFKQKIFITGHQIQEHKPVLPRNVKVVKDYKGFKRFVG
jgi:methanogenic corrinoid protein MtbC1